MVKSIPLTTDILFLSLNPWYHKYGQFLQSNIPGLLIPKGCTKSKWIIKGGFIGTFSMIISRKAIKKLKILFKKMIAPTDLALGNFAKKGLL